MRVLLVTFGSTGDVFPMIRLGVALRERGHAVRLGTARLFRADAERAGLDFLPLPPHWDQARFAEAMRELDRARNPLSQIKRIYRFGVRVFPQFIGLLDEALAHCDLLVGSYLFPYLGAVASRRGVPYAAAVFCHSVVPASESPPPGAPALRFLPGPLRRRLHGVLWHLGNAVLDHTLNREVGVLLREAGLPPVRDFILKPADLALVMVAENLLRPAGQIPSCFKFCGYLRHQAPPDPAIDATIHALTGGARVPVLTFGSVVGDDSAAAMDAFLQNWPAHRPLIVQSGWAGLGLGNQRPHVAVVGRVSHDQLFAHASVIIHHGGAGTTASALHAGRPQIIIPHIGDQPFWGQCVENLGCGLKLPRRHWPRKLPSAIDRLECDTETQARALACAALLAAEDGPARAVRLLEEYVAQSARICSTISRP